MPAVTLPGFDRSTFEHDGMSHEVYRAGGGPAVIVTPELPGLHPGVIAFGRRLVDAGYTAYLPSLFGRPDRPHTQGMLPQVLRACISREFAMFADRTSRVNSWLMALARAAHAASGGPGVGAVGMCFTGGFALAMAVDDSVVAPVLSQPSLPVRTPAGLALDPEDLARVKQRTAAGLCVLGLRFTNDRYVRSERFARLRGELGEAFLAVEIDSSPGNPYDIPESAHSVLTLELNDEPGHPTRQALDQVMQFLAERLKPVS